MEFIFKLIAIIFECIFLMRIFMIAAAYVGERIGLGKFVTGLLDKIRK